MAVGYIVCPCHPCAFCPPSCPVLWSRCGNSADLKTSVTQKSQRQCNQGLAWLASTRFALSADSKSTSLSGTRDVHIRSQLHDSWEGGCKFFFSVAIILVCNWLFYKPLKYKSTNPGLNSLLERRAKSLLDIWQHLTEWLLTITGRGKLMAAMCCSFLSTAASSNIVRAVPVSCSWGSTSK
jgi:hypothetical protein